MNNDDPRTQQATSTPAQYETSQVRPARADADEASALARHGDPSQPKTHTAQQATGSRHVALSWCVRPSC